MSSVTSAAAVRRLGFRENWPQLALLVLVNALVGGMVGVERTVVPLVATQEFGMTSDTLIFSFIAAFGIVKALSNVASGLLADRFTRKVMLVSGWVIGLPVPFILAWGPSWSWIIGANLLLGASQGLTWSMTVAMKADLVRAEERGLAMGLNEFAGYGGLGITALLTGYVAARTGLRPEPFYVGIGYAVLGLALSLAAVRDTTGFLDCRDDSAAPQQESQSIQSENAGKNRRTMFGVCQAGLVNNLNDGMSWGVFPLVFAAHGLAVDHIGIIKAVYPLTWSVAQLGTGALSDRIGRRPLIVWGMTVQAGALALIGLGLEGPFAFAAGVCGAVALGLGTAMVYPALLALAADASSTATRATTLGWYRFWRDLGYPIGAVLAGLVGAAVGLVWAVHLAGALTFASGLAAATLLAAEPLGNRKLRN